MEKLIEIFTKIAKEKSFKDAIYILGQATKVYIDSGSIYAATGTLLIDYIQAFILNEKSNINNINSAKLVKVLTKCIYCQDKYG